MSRNNILPRFSGPLHFALSNGTVFKRLQEWNKENPGNTLPLSAYDVQALAYSATRPDVFADPRHKSFAARTQMARTRAPDLALEIERLIRISFSSPGSPQDELRAWWCIHGLRTAFDQRDSVLERTDHFSKLSPQDRDGKRPEECGKINGRLQSEDLLGLVEWKQPYSEHVGKKLIPRLRDEMDLAQRRITELWPDFDQGE
jgi:hypothetical protein